MKEKFITKTLILIIGGLITKVLGLFIKVLITRKISLEGLSLYTLILPTFNLAITITSLSLPISLSKLVSEDKYNNKNLLINTIPISIIVNIITIFILVLSSKFISINLLKEERCINLLISISLTLPFISMSSIIRSYFFGKQKMLPHVISNILEQVIRIILIIYLIPIFNTSNIEHLVSIVILINIISELSSFLILFLFLPNKLTLKKNDFKINKLYIKKILDISIPNTFSRITSSIFYFLEPILLTYFMLKSGYTTKYIQREYAILESYVLPLIMLPNFFTIAISNVLLPTISNYYSNNKINLIKKRIKTSILISLIIGIITVTIININPSFFLKLIFNTDKGITYLKIISPIFIIYYILPTLTSTLQALNKSKILLKNELIGIIIKTLSIILLTPLKTGIYPLIIGISLNILLTSFLHLKALKKVLEDYSLIKEKAKSPNTIVT